MIRRPPNSPLFPSPPLSRSFAAPPPRRHDVLTPHGEEPLRLEPQDASLPRRPQRRQLDLLGEEQRKVERERDAPRWPEVLAQRRDRLRRMLPVPFDLNGARPGPIPALEPHAAQRARAQLDAEPGHYRSRSQQPGSTSRPIMVQPPAIPAYHLTTQAHARGGMASAKLPLKPEGVNLATV